MLKIVYQNLKNDNINVESKILTYKKEDQLIDLEKNVKIVDLNNNIIIKSEKIFYDLQKKIIFSNVESQIIDFNKNNYFVKKFKYNLDLKLLKLENIKFLDINKNQLTSEIAYLDIKKETLAGKDLIINLSESKINPENNPRLKGKKSFVYENNKFLVNKGNFTLCKIRMKNVHLGRLMQKLLHMIMRKRRFIMIKHGLNFMINLFCIFQKFFIQIHQSKKIGFFNTKF